MSTKTVIIAILLSVVALAASVHAARSSCTSTSNTISYQVHSWNDLRSWRAGFMKGMQWMKIDPNWQNASFCASQAQVKNQDPRGCFILNHNPPIPEQIRYTYNTTDDVFNFILDSENTPFFTNPSRRIHIALCFKVEGFSVCDNSSDNSNFLSLISDFKQRADQLIDENNLNLEFILDGSATVQAPPGSASQCTANLWTPWNMTFIYLTNPVTAYIQNDQDLGDYRFQVLNTPVETGPLRVPELKLWDFISYTHYGKYKDAIYPYLIWEPSEQVTIQAAAQVYLSRGEIHEEGLRFATNLDPVQFQVYAGECSGTSWNFELNQTGGLDTNAKQPAVLVFGSSVDASSGTLVAPFHAVSVFVGANGTYQQTVSFPEVLSSTKTTGSISLLSSNSVSFVGFSHISIGANQYAVMVDGTGVYTIYSFSASTFSLARSGSGSFEGSARIIAASVISQGSDVYGIVMRSTASCVADFALYVFSSDLTTTKQIGSAVCASMPSRASTLQSASISLAPTPAAFPKSVCGSEFIGLAVVADADKQVMLGGVCVSIAGDISPVRFSVVTVGANPQVSVQANGTDVYGMVVVGEGFCWNTETQNKDASIGLCDLTPTPSNLSLAYTYSRIENFFARAAAGSSFTSCDAEVLNGAYDYGLWPFVSLFHTSTNQFAVMEIHHGVPPALMPPENSPDSLCGVPIVSEHLLLDAWSLPDI